MTVRTKTTIPVSGIHLTQYTNPETGMTETQVLAEVEGEWRTVISELTDGGPISHIVEPAGIATAPVAPRPAD